MHFQIPGINCNNDSKTQLHEVNSRSAANLMPSDLRLLIEILSHPASLSCLLISATGSNAQFARSPSLSLSLFNMQMSAARTESMRKSLCSPELCQLQHCRKAHNAHCKSLVQTMKAWKLYTAPIVKKPANFQNFFASPLRFVVHSDNLLFIAN